MTLPHDTKLKAVAQMFAAMQHDWEEAAKSPSRHVGHITRTNYKPKFDVSDEDILAYCNTLTPLTPIFPVCVMCGEKWHWYDKTYPMNQVKPSGNDGFHINNYDSISTFCPSENHDTIWLYQGRESNRCEISREVEGLNGYDFVIRWCEDDVNEIKLISGSHRTRNEKHTVIKHFDPPIPYNISHEDLWKLIEGNMLLL